ncbi:RNB domain-containing ribonuclease [Catenulispora pinistramenti]|uniref:RNB domain-containing ribonuclease n=1 Tax=Catenulispora pinistramenti TaxID=2705254 RepID=UPI001E33D565|nr:RNB domain-containing ribonuclease [Catenulispora pinistramenti]
MPQRVLTVEAAVPAADLRAGFDAVRAELQLPGPYSQQAMAEAEAAAKAPRMPAADATDLPLVTLDPAESMDLDQAMHLEKREGGGYRVHYAIADIAAFVEPGGVLDLETHRRGETYYMPDMRVPLHPEILSEGAASLLPDQDRPALLWQIDLDSSGDTTGVEVRRARVRSRAKLNYQDTQAALDNGTADPVLRLLREIGTLRQDREAERGGISLSVPAQVVVADGDSWSLEYRTPLPVENWNAQISLLTGMAAAELMVYGEIGLLRTMPDPPEFAYHRLHRVARALRIRWPDGVSYSELIRKLDPAIPAHAAFLQETTTLMRGAGYTAFDGGVPERPGHSALATTYAHVTAPLRRLADRYAGEVCVALCGGAEVPDWARSELPRLPAVMEGADRRGSAVDRECVDLVETMLLKDQVGQEFDAVVIDLNERIDWDHNGKPDVGIVQLTQPAVRARCDGHDLPLGQQIEVRLAEANVTTRRILFEATDPRYTVRDRPVKNNNGGGAGNVGGASNVGGANNSGSGNNGGGGNNGSAAATSENADKG